MDRLERFEQMLTDLGQNCAAEKQKMDLLKAQGKEKTATYRQHMGSKLLYGQMLALYKVYGLMGEETT